MGGVALSAVSGCEAAAPLVGAVGVGGRSPDLDAAIALTRFGMGARPGDLERVGSDARGWLKAQIRPEGADQPVGPDLESGAATMATYREFRDFRRQSLRAATAMTGDAEPSPDPAPVSPQDARAARLARREARRAAAEAAPGSVRPDRGDSAVGRLSAEVGARIALAVGAEAGFRERWTLFWANHFSVSAVNQGMRFLAGVFEREAIRPHVFGRFDDMLLASTQHPGMLTYLNQAESVGPGSAQGQRRGRGLNENLAREILELHTVGADAGYGQADVTEFARALTGWTIGRANEPTAGNFVFRATGHEPGARRVLGRTYPEGGEAQARAILASLAADPRTAKRLCRKLAAHFVADDPPPVLVARLERAWTGSDGDLAAVANALIDAPEAWTPAANKMKTPYDWVVSAHRALGARASRDPTIGALAELGARPLSPPSPEGWPDEAAAWATPSGMVKRLAYAEMLSASADPALGPEAIAQAALGARLRPATATAVARAESRAEALTLLLMSPEFQRR